MTSIHVDATAGLPDKVAMQVSLYESKAAWCEEHGFPGDAIEHRAYVAQLRRSAQTREVLEAIVPPLRGCALCLYSAPLQGELHCHCPAVREVHGVKPVRVVRASSEACGPGATYMDMMAWRQA